MFANTNSGGYWRVPTHGNSNLNRLVEWEKMGGRWGLGRYQMGQYIESKYPGIGDIKMSY